MSSFCKHSYPNLPESLRLIMYSFQQVEKTFIPGVSQTQLKNTLESQRADLVADSIKGRVRVTGTETLRGILSVVEPEIPSVDDFNTLCLIVNSKKIAAVNMSDATPTGIYNFLTRKIAREPQYPTLRPMTPSRIFLQFLHQRLKDADELIEETGWLTLPQPTGGGYLLLMREREKGLTLTFATKLPKTGSGSFLFA